METMEQQIYCPKAYNPLTFFAIIALVTLIGYFFSACTGSAKPAANSSGTSLDMAIAEAAGRMETRLNVGTKIALINFSSSSAQFSEYVLEGISLHLVNGGKLVVVDRANLDRVRQEQGFQLSGDVSDESAKAIGQMLGADAIVTGSLTNIGREYRINLKAITVEAATVAVQYAADIAADERVRTLLASGGGSGGGTTAFSESRTSGSGTGQTQTVQIPSQSTAQTSAQSKVIIVEGASLAEKLQWIEANAANDTEYRVEVTANESLSAPVLSYPRRRYVTIRLISNGGEKVLSLTGSGSIFTIESDVTLILDNGITLQGRKGNNASLVTVNSRGT
ncbi:MAG: penicillin-binding protein activator LpoB, partial [Treponema sp.]|nr:penicillin-binding protein activator LpoB [Treponema sp.]